MTKLFWEPLIEIEEIKIKIDEHGLVEEQKLHLLEIVYHTYNLRIVDVILSNLPEKKHKQFLDKYSESSHYSKFLDWLKEEVNDVEEKIKEITEKIKKEILEELYKL